MKRYLVLYGLSIAALLTALTAHAQDDITVTKNEDGTWSFVKPADLDIELEVVYFTQKELDAMAALAKRNAEPLPVADTETDAETDDDDDEEETEELSATQTSEKSVSEKDTKVKKKDTKKKRSRHKRSRRRSR